LLAPLIEAFAGDHDLFKLTETMLRSNLFFSPAACWQRIKSPVEFALGIVQGMEAGVSTMQLGRDLAGLGQNLLNPPTVKGWAGGTNWINPATLVGRANLARNLLRGSGVYGDKLNPWAVAVRHGHNDPESAGRFLRDLLLQGELSPDQWESLAKEAALDREAKATETAARRLALALVNLPEFQLA